MLHRSRRRHITSRPNEGALIAIRGRIVCVTHVISDPDNGDILETVDGNEDDGVVFLFGYNNVDPSYEGLIRGCRSGQSREGEITYLPPDPDAVFEADREKFPAEGRPGAPIQGEVMHMETDEGLPVFARVVYCDENTLRLSTNDILAGKTVHVALKVTKVRAAYPEELASGFPLAYQNVG